MILYSLAQFWQSTYKHNRTAQVTFALSILLNLVIWVLFFWRLRPFSYLIEHGNIPLHYNLYFGIDIYGQWWHSLSLPLIGLLVIICNTTMSYQLFNHEKILSYFLMLAQVAVQIMLLASIIFIILLNS